MRVDHVDTAPVPQPQVHLPRAVLVIAGDDQLAPLGGELAREVQRPLLADGLDHPLAEATFRQRLHLLDDGAVVVHRDGLGRAHLPRHVERERPPGNGDHPRPGVRGEPGQERAKEADADDRHGLAGANVGAAEDVHGAAQGFAWERLARQLRRQRDHGPGLSQVVLGIGVVGECGDPIAHREPLHPLAHRVDHAPALMAEAARLGRELHPFRAFPGGQVGGADAAAFQAHPHLSRAGLGQRHLIDPDHAGRSHHRRPHARRVRAERRRRARAHTRIHRRLRAEVAGRRPAPPARRP